jgi:hypothetical protein
MSQDLPHPASAPTWRTTFTSEECASQLAEDRQAWRAIAGILLAIIGFGLLLGVSTVLLIVAWG